MGARRFQDIWLEQCSATVGIRERFGLLSAFDYLVREKLINYAEAAAKHPEFARELPRFVAEVRRIFDPAEIREHLARIEREQAEDDSFDDEDPYDVAAAKKRRATFRSLKELLTAERLGTS